MQTEVKYDDMSFVEQSGELKLPKEWEEILEGGETEQ